MIMPMPIMIPYHTSGSHVPMEHPPFVVWFLGASLIIALIGAVITVVGLVLYLLFDLDVEKLENIGISITLIAAIMILIGVAMAAFTGTPIEQ